FSSRRRHTRWPRDWSSDVCSSDLLTHGSLRFELALSCLRKGGSATLVGNVAPKIQFPLQTAVTRELTIHGSCASRGEYPACLDRSEERRVGKECRGRWWAYH